MNNSLDECRQRLCYRPAYFQADCHNIYMLTDFNRTVMELLDKEGCNCTSLMRDNNIANFACDQSPIVHDWWVQCIYVFMFAMIVLTSIGGNAIVIWIVLAHKNMRTKTNYFLINLAISDASISLFNVCFSFTFNLYYAWYFGRVYCVLNNFMGVAPTCSSVFTLVTMSLDRYYAIVYPLKPHLSKKKTIAVIICIWITACFCGLPMLLFSHTKTFYLSDGSENTVCFSDDYPDGDAQTSYIFQIYNYFLLSVTYLLPLAILSVAYTRIGLELWGAKQIGEHCRVENIQAKRKVVKMFIFIVIIFMTCWLPYHLYFTIFIKMFTEINIFSAIYIYLNMYWLAMSSTVCNPFIYCYMNSKFRVGFKYVFRCLPCIRLRKEDYGTSSLKRQRFDSIAYTMTVRRASPPDGNSAIPRIITNRAVCTASPQMSERENFYDDETFDQNASLLICNNCQNELLSSTATQVNDSVAT